MNKTQNTNVDIAKRIRKHRKPTNKFSHCAWKSQIKFCDFFVFARKYFVGHCKIANFAY